MEKSSKGGDGKGNVHPRQREYCEESHRNKRAQVVFLAG